MHYQKTKKQPANTAAFKHKAVTDFFNKLNF